MATPQTVNEQIEAAHRGLKKLRRRIRLGSWMTTIVGLLLLALVAGYFTYGYVQISGFKDPELLVSLVGQTIDQSIPQLRQRVETEVDNNAATWAQQVSEQALAAAPALRENLEDYICKGTDALIDELEVVGEREFRRMLTENRSTMEQALKELDDEHAISDGTVLLLEEALEKELQISMEDQAQAVLTMLSDVNKNMKQLAEGENLGPVQQCERRVLMLARRLQLEWFGDVRIEDLAPRALTETVEQLERERLQKQAADAAAETAKLSEGEPAKPEAKQPEQSETDQPDKPEAKQPEQSETDQPDQPETEKTEQAAEADSSPAADQEAGETEAPKSQESSEE
jgi:hypothetical protein